MRRTVAVAAIAMAILALVVTPAFAGGKGVGGNPGVGGGKLGLAFALEGIVTARDPVAETITVTVWAGNQWVKDYIAKSLTVVVTADTKIRRSADPEGTFITLADVPVEATVNIGGLYDPAANLFTAQRVILNSPLHTGQ